MQRGDMLRRNAQHQPGVVHLHDENFFPRPDATAGPDCQPITAAAGGRQPQRFQQPAADYYQQQNTEQRTADLGKRAAGAKGRRGRGVFPSRDGGASLTRQPGVGVRGRYSGVASADYGRLRQPGVASMDDIAASRTRVTGCSVSADWPGAGAAAVVSDGLLRNGEAVI